MAFYSTGTATGTGAGDALMVIMDTALTGGGWTMIDAINNSSGTRDKVYKGTALDATAGNAPYIRLTQTSTTNIAFRCYQDWDTTTHVGMNETGNGTTNPSLTVQDTSFTYFMRVNPVAMLICAKIGANYNKMYAGFLRRGLGLTRSGVTKTSGSTAALATTINVASDMTSKLKVGQTIQIINYGHSSASANASHVEKRTIQSITASTVVVTVGLTSAYDSGALVGENALPVCIGGGTSGGTTGLTSNCLFPYEIDGARTSTTGQTAASNEIVLNSSSANAPSTGWNEYAPGIYDISSTTSGKTGFRGWYYHSECTTKGAQALEDIMSDGDNDFIIVGLGTSLVNCIGPRN